MKYNRLLILLIFTACSTASNKNDREVISSNDSLANEVPADWTISEVGKGYKIYANIAHYFPGTNEFYVTVNAQTGLELKYEQLTSSLDSLVYQDEEYTRRRLPMTMAKKWFELDLLDDIKVYSRQGEYLTDASLTRVEYHEDMILSQFIAVLEPSENVVDDSGVYIVVNQGPLEIMNNQIFEKFESISVTRDLISKTGIGSDHVISKSHVENKTSGIVYSCISTMTKDFKNTSYLIESVKSTISVLMKFSEDYILDEIFMSPLVSNSKPVLLFEISVPDTDISWYSIAYFDGEKYKLTNHSTFEIENSQKQEN